MDIQELVKQTIQATTDATVKELKRQGLMKKEGQTPFQKTETLLYSYSKFEAAVKQKHQDIEDIEKHGVACKSKSFVQWSKNAPLSDLSQELEKKDNAIDQLKKAIIKTESYISEIDIALNGISDDPYFDIIPMKYFEGQTREEIAEHFEVDVSTISRQKNRLMNMLQIRLFPVDVFENIFY